MNRFGLYLHTELLNSWIAPCLSLNLSTLREMPSRAEARRQRRQHISFFRFSPAACEGERGKNGSQQSNKKEEQWRHWIAKYQVWIPSFASLGLPSSVRLNYVLLTVSSHVGSVVVFADKVSGSAWSNCLWLSWVSPSTMQGLSKRSKVTVKKYYYEMWY